MREKNIQTVKTIFALYLIATVMLLCFGYSVQKPATLRQEFPFSITYSFDGETKTISDIYVAEYNLAPKYLGERGLKWYGYVKDRNRLESDYYSIGDKSGYAFFINLNLEPGFLMGDPYYSEIQCLPAGVAYAMVGEEEIRITDPMELEKLGFTIVEWEYPQAIENTFYFGAISLSGEAAVFTTAMAIVALFACMILTGKDKGLVYGTVDKCSIVLNFAETFIVFPFVLICSVLSEIVADVSVAQQVLYLTPALTVLGIAASVVLRRMGYGKNSLVIQLVGPALMSLLFAADLVG